MLGSALSVERVYLGAPALVAIGVVSAGLGLMRRLNPLLILACAGAAGVVLA